MDNRKVMIENLTKGTAAIIEPHLNMKLIWQTQGAKRPVDLELLKQAMYSPGVETMFREGVLRIAEKDAMDILVELGLEEEGAKEPENVVILTDGQRKRLLSSAPIVELEEMLEKLPLEQMRALVDYAVDNKMTDYERCSLIKEASGFDIIKTVELNKADEEN